MRYFLNQDSTVIHNLKILGPPVDDCTWTGWIDDDNPLRHCDCEKPPDGCLVQDYQIKDMSTGKLIYPKYYKEIIVKIG